MAIFQCTGGLTNATMSMRVCIVHKRLSGSGNISESPGRAGEGGAAQCGSLAVWGKGQVPSFPR